MDPATGIETLKLLLQVAWADDEIEPAEARAILDLGVKLGLGRGDLERVAAFLRGEAKLPPPDLGLLRLHREEVLAEVCAVLGADRRFAEEEEQILDELRELLAS